MNHYINDSQYKIIDFMGIMGAHENTAEFLFEISNGFIISGGYDNKLFIYNESFNKIIEIKDFKDWPNSICEIQNNKNENIYKIVVNCRLEIYFIILDLENNIFNMYKKSLPHISNIICFEIKKNTYIISGDMGVYYFSDLTPEKEKFSPKKISKNPYKCGIKINSNTVALASNRILTKGKDELIFYNSESKKIVKSISNYSFINNVNGLYLMNIDETNNILLCACKKYFPDQKNGILLVNPEIGGNDVIEPFYDSGEFEIFCFCQIYLKGISSNYFLVGGFDIEKREGAIKLYQLICNRETSKAKIEFILDIVIEKGENYQGFEKPINCIIQSKKNGNIIASSWDGKIYLFSPPNLDYYLLNDTISKSNEKLFC